MSITGVAKVIYGVDDLPKCTTYYQDFGLDLVDELLDFSLFELEEGSLVELRKADDPSLAPRYFDGPGVREVIWGVDNQANLNAFEKDLRQDHDITKADDGSLHFLTLDEIPLGLTVFNPKPVLCAPDPINAPGSIARFNQLRKWRTRARPKNIQHVVFAVSDVEKSWAFYRDRLHFRLSDVSRGLGIFARADGRREHHSIFFERVGAIPGRTHPEFDHVNFGVEDIDEMLVGANYMERHGWRVTRERLGGFGRHRISSALFCYFDCPCGGKAEYGADTDYLDDGWVPREWDAGFGSNAWTAELPPYLKKEAKWDVKLLKESDDTGDS